VTSSSDTPLQPCPDCGKALQLRVDSPAYATQLFMRCDTCGAVWVLDRSDSSKPPRLYRKPKQD